MTKFKIIPKNHALRTNIENFIRKTYSDNYDAYIADFPPNLLAAFAKDTGKIRATCGLRFGKKEGFSDIYLKSPVAAYASQAAGYAIIRDEIIEVTTLSSAQAGMAFPLLEKTVEIGRKQGMKAGIFTATAHLRSLMRRVGLPLQDLGAASSENIDNKENWGSYYDTDPHVCLLIDRLSAPLVMDVRHATASKKLLLKTQARKASEYA